MPLVDLTLFDPIFAPLRGRRAGLTHNRFGNVGDALIRRGVLTLCRRHSIDVVSLPDPPADDTQVDHLILHGGGNIGYPGSDGIRSRAIASLPTTPATFLPNSLVQGPPPVIRHVRAYARESVTATITRWPLVPDCAFACDVPRVIVAGPPRLMLRRDNEAGVITTGDDPAMTLGDSEADVDRYLDIAAAGGPITTNRLHLAIACLHVGQSVTLTDCSYHKNRSMWITWLRALGCGWTDDPIGYHNAAVRRDVAPSP